MEIVLIQSTIHSLLIWKITRGRYKAFLFHQFYQKYKFTGFMAKKNHYVSTALRFQTDFFLSFFLIDLGCWTDLNLLIVNLTLRVSLFYLHIVEFQSFICVNYGQLVDNLPSSEATVKLFKLTTIGKVKLNHIDRSSSPHQNWNHNRCCQWWHCEICKVPKAPLYSTVGSKFPLFIPWLCCVNRVHLLHQL